MGIRRVCITFDESQRGTARRVYEVLSENTACFDTMMHDAAAGGKVLIEFVASSAEVKALLAFLGSYAGIGSDETASVTISDTLTMMPPIDQRITQRFAASSSSPPELSRTRSHKTLRQAMTLEEVRSRMTVDEIFSQIDSSSKLTFDYVFMVIAAAAIAAAGLIEDSSVTVVASMLLSPLMSPILAITFGLAVGHAGLTRRGLRNELVGVAVSLGVGLCVGSALAPVFGPHAFNKGVLDPHRSVDGESWAALGVNVSWPYVLESTQIRSRGSASSLVSGTLVAVPSGFAVVLAITGGSTNALVGVAIAAALLPPIVNAGLCFSLAFWWQWLDPQANWWRDLTQIWEDEVDLLFGDTGTGPVGAAGSTTTTITTTVTTTSAAVPEAPPVPGMMPAAAATTTEVPPESGAVGAAEATASSAAVAAAAAAAAAAASAAAASAAAAGIPTAAAPPVNVTTIVTTTQTTTLSTAQVPSISTLPTITAARHPYLVVAVHGFWSFVLFILNLISIVVVGTATFWLKGVSRHAEDSSAVIGERFRERRALLSDLSSPQQAPRTAENGDGGGSRLPERLPASGPLADEKALV